MKLVRFTECNKAKAEVKTRLRPRAGESDSELIERAVEKIYGKRCFWWADSGLGLYYGQIMRALPPTKGNSNPGNSAVTYRVRVDIEEG